MEGSFEVTRMWLLPGEVKGRRKPVYLHVDVEPLDSEFVSRYKNKVHWRGAECVDLGYLWMFSGTKTFVTNANTKEGIIAAIKEELRAL